MPTFSASNGTLDLAFAVTFVLAVAVILVDMLVLGLGGLSRAAGRKGISSSESDSSESASEADSDVSLSTSGLESAMIVLGLAMAHRSDDRRRARHGGSEPSADLSVE